MTESYVETIALVERLHRQVQEVVKAELERIDVRDLNSVQALILFNLGSVELSVGELMQRGYYQGSNVSYNVKKLVENEYLLQRRCPHDRRSIFVRASEKGVEISNRLAHLFAEQAKLLARDPRAEEALDQSSKGLALLQRFWAADGLVGVPQEQRRIFTAA